ncbi:MAG: hypothetical protein AB1716_12975 [Planctomycetota bacterium]
MVEFPIAHGVQQRCLAWGDLTVQEPKQRGRAAHLFRPVRLRFVEHPIEPLYGLGCNDVGEPATAIARRGDESNVRRTKMCTNWLIVLPESTHADVGALLDR